MKRKRRCGGLAIFLGVSADRASRACERLRLNKSGNTTLTPVAPGNRLEGFAKPGEGRCLVQDAGKVEPNKKPNAPALPAHFNV